MHPEDLKQLRLKLRLTQAEMAKELGISRVMIGLMERGQKPISPRTLSALRAIKPARLSRDTTEPDPLRRYIERALILSGIEYTIDFSIDDTMIDFYLPDHGIGIFARRSRSDEELTAPPGLDYITAIGKRATVALGELIRSGAFPATISENAIYE